MGKGNRRYDFLENNYYHIYNRGYNKQIIFQNKSDYEKFYAYMIKNLEKYTKLKLVAYSLLPNHFHFIIHNLGSTGTPDISMFMKCIQGAYALWFKASRGTGTQKSPFFEGRFKSRLIDNEKYFYQCLAYVNFNPLKHEIVKDINDYPWTSYHQIIDKSNINNYKDLILEEL